MIAQIRTYLNRYAFVFIWLIAGAANKFLGAAAVVLTLLALIRAGRKTQILVSLWLLFMFSDNRFGLMDFAEFIKPVTMLLVGGAIALGKIKIESKNRFLYPLLPFFIYAGVISLFSVVWFSSYQKLLSYFLLFYIVSTLVLQIRKEGKMKELFQDLVVVGVSILTISLVLGLLFPFIGSYFGGRLNGIFRNPNGMGLFTTVYFMMSTVLFGMSKQFSRFLKRYSFILVIICLTLTGSRTSLGASLIFYMGGLMASLSPVWFIVMASSLAFFFNDIYTMALEFVGRAGLSQQLRVSNLDYASGRIYIWRAAWMEIQENFFLFGGGFDYAEGAYYTWKSKYDSIIPDLKYHVGNIHQSFLTVWMNTGLFGLILFVYGWLSIIFKAMTRSRLTLPLAFALVFMAWYESWLVASMNPFTLQVVLTFVIILNQGMSSLNEGAEESQEQAVALS